MIKENTIKLAKKIKEGAERLMLDFEEKKLPKATYINLYDWSCQLVRKLENE